MGKKKDKKWIQNAELKEGAFTKQAKDAGYGVQTYASRVLKNPENYDKTTVRRARLAQTFKNMA